jgi:U32 family peptidase
MARKSELLMPAGNLTRLKVAFRFGADAVYIGTPDLSLRTKSGFDLEDVVEGIDFAHKIGKKVYLTLNLFSHNKDIEKLPNFIDTIKECNPDGVIIADPGVFNYVKKHAPHLELHISTQANICSWLSVKFWEDQGAGLCVMARETSYQELAEIREKCPDIKLEAFVHGSMCMTYSGRCLLSNFMAERGANQGSCAHSCRWNYKLKMQLKDGTMKEIDINDQNQDLFEFFLEEEIRPGEFLPFEEDVRGSYILNSKDLCLMPKLDEYLKIGIDSLKVEGRNKSMYYVAIVARAYRMAIDAYYKDPENWDPKPYLNELAAVSNRGYTLAFHDGRLTNLAHNYDNTRSIADWEFAGVVIAQEEDSIIVEVKNRLVAGDVLEFVSPDSEQTILLRLYEFYNVKKQEISEVVNPGYKPQIKIPFSKFDKENPADLKKILTEYTMIRKEKPVTATDIARLNLDKEASKLEIGKGSEIKHQDKTTKLNEAMEGDNHKVTFKTPRVGTDGCCGRGCNGCLIFWHDAKYEKARDKYLQLKPGQLL